MHRVKSAPPGNNEVGTCFLWDARYATSDAPTVTPRTCMVQDIRTLTPLLLLLALAASGCRSDAPPPSEPDSRETCLSFEDDLRRRVVLEAPARRIVSLAPNLTEILYAAGAGAYVVGVTPADDYPPAVAHLSRVSAMPVNAEAIAALRPDLVVATDQVNSPRLTDMMDAMNIPVAFFTFDAVDDIFRAIRTVGELAGTSARANATADSLQQTFERLKKRTAHLRPDERPSVLLLIGDRTLYSFGAGSYVQEMIRAAGARSITADLQRPAPNLSDEFVLQRAPDVVFGTWGADYDVGRLLAHHPTWRVLPAVRNGRIYSLPPSLILRPGPRVIAGTRALAEKLHPRL